MRDERAVLQRVLEEADAFLDGLDSRPVRPQTDVDGTLDAVRRVLAEVRGPLSDR